MSGYFTPGPMSILLVCFLFASSVLSAACSPPNIRVTIIGGPKKDTAEFSVPLFKDCNFGDPAPVTPKNPPAPPTAITASANYNNYVDATGKPLDKGSTNALLEFFGNSVSLDILLEQTICTITDTKNGIWSIEAATEDLDEGQVIPVSNYRCIIDL